MQLFVLKYINPCLFLLPMLCGSGEWYSLMAFENLKSARNHKQEESGDLKKSYVRSYLGLDDTLFVAQCGLLEDTVIDNQALQLPFLYWQYSGFDRFLEKGTEMCLANPFDNFGNNRRVRISGVNFILKGSRKSRIYTNKFFSKKILRNFFFNLVR